MVKKRGFVFFFVAMIAPIFGFSALAQQTDYGHIVAFQTGSLGQGFFGRPADDTVIVGLDVDFQNSSSGTFLSGGKTPCKGTKQLYALQPQDAGIKLNEAVLLAAYLSGRKVSLVLDGCVFDMPRVISVNMLTSQN